MPLCGIISSECLGTLPGAWAKQCEMCLKLTLVNGWETQLELLVPGALQRIRNKPPFGRPALWKLSPAGARSPFLTHTFFFILGFLLIVAECPRSPPSKKKKKSTSRYTQVGLCKPTWWVLHVVMFCPPLGCGAENVSKNQTWELRPINKSSETVAWQKRSVNVPKKGASM